MIPPPQTEAELRRLIDHLGDPEAFAQWLARILDPEVDLYAEDVCPPLDNRAGQRPDEQGRLPDV